MPQQSAQSSSETDPTAICSCKRTDHPCSTQWGCNNTVQGSQQFCDELCTNDPSCHASLSSQSQNMQGNTEQGGTNEVAFETFDRMAAHFEDAQQGSCENLGGDFDFSAPSRPPSINDLLSMQEQVARMDSETQRTFRQWFNHYARTWEEWYNPDGEST